VKIVNPAKKTDFICRELHHFNSRFESVTAIRMKLIDEFQQQVPNSVSFSIGYFERRQQSCGWLQMMIEDPCILSTLKVK